MYAGYRKNTRVEFGSNLDRIIFVGFIQDINRGREGSGEGKFKRRYQI